MRGLRCAFLRLGMQARRPRVWLFALALFCLGPLSRWIWARSVGLDPGRAPTPSTLAIGILTGLYCACTVTVSAHRLAERLSNVERLGLRCGLLAITMATLGACTLLGDAWSSTVTVHDAPTAQDWVGWALSTLVLTALAAAVLPWCAAGGRCFLAVVALAWWIPAVLPPSFLFAVPRALRGAFEGGRALALPSDPVGWLADTALAAGLLLLAWAPRRATFRGDEVRHPG